MQQRDRTCFPSDTEYDEVKRCYFVLDDNSPGMYAVKDYYDYQLRARVAAVERDIALERELEDEDEDDYFVRFFRAEDKKNRTLIDQQHTRHFVEGASLDNHYDIQGASAPFERPFSGAGCAGQDD